MISKRPKFLQPKVLVLIIVLVLAAAFVITAYSLNLFGLSDSSQNICNQFSASPNAPGIFTANLSASTVNILVVESDPGSTYEGMNGSAFHLSVPWPVITVHQGQTVVIHVINCASSEPHGFAITHYFDAGVTVRPGGSYILRFVADQKGTFRMYCNIFCVIHALMQNGELVVI